MDLEKIKKNMIKGKPARLFPVLPDSKKEERATSVLLAVFAAVPDLARDVLGDAGAPIGKRSSLSVFTEVSFKGGNPKTRPDGLIVVTLGGKNWAALIETKVGRSDLTTEQVEDYLDLAKEQGFDALITISNQFAAIPNHHPVTVSKTKTRHVGLYHFSWLSIVSRALVLTDQKVVKDVEQAFLLSELIRFLRDEKSGISSDVRMSTEWKQICELVHQNTPLRKSDKTTEEAVSDWFELIRYLSIRLSVVLGESCSVWMARKFVQDPSSRLQHELSELVSKQELSTEIEIPKAAGRVHLTVSLLRKTIDLRVNLETPKDVKQQRAAINFVLAQFKGSPMDDLIVRVNWPRRVPSTELPLQRALDEEERKALIPENFKDLPSSIDLIRVIDLGVRVKTSTGLPERAEQELIRFYQEVLQGLRKWVPDAPKIRRAAVDTQEVDTSNSSPTLDESPVSISPFRPSSDG